MGRFGQRFTAFRDQLFRLDDRERLSKLSFTLLLALDLFILIVLFEGLAEHTRQLTSPEEYAPYTCRQVFINREWNEGNRLDKLQPLVLAGYENISYRYDSLLERADTERMHLSCSELYVQFKSIAADNNLKALFIQRKQLLKERRDLEANIATTRRTYDTSLLETIAEKRKRDEQLAAIAAKSKQRSTQIDALTDRLAQLEKEINDQPLIASLWQLIAEQPERRAALVSDYRDYQFWYALKKLLWQLLFILPIFAFFYLWSNYSARRHHTIQTLISSHLLVVSAIPIFLKLVELLLDLIPRHFLKRLFELLESLHLIALWHYFVIAAAVVAGLLLIYLVQKKLFSHKRTLQARLMKGECHNCGLKLPPNSRFCPFCGAEQSKVCSSCQEETPYSSDFCTRCGKPQ